MGTNMKIVPKLKNYIQNPKNQDYELNRIKIGQEKKSNVYTVLAKFVFGPVFLNNSNYNPPKKSIQTYLL